MLTSEFDFDLPTELIAQRPLARGEARLMVLSGDEAPRHERFGDLPDHLREGDLVIVNDTRVIPARLFGRRAGSGGRLELLLVERVGPLTWTCLAKPGRRARPGTEITLPGGIDAEVRETLDDGRYLVDFSEPLEPRLDEVGVVPLPPYIKRPSGERDERDYQTIFAAAPGAIAAPTAGLHFTDEMRQRLTAGGIDLHTVTLHVGIGTFKPVTVKLVHEHRMEAERYLVPAATAEAIARTRERGGRVVAIGTTVVRTLEGAAAEHGLPLGAVSGRTGIFIRPGHSFRVVDVLLTNFHLPRSTLLMLVSAFAGRERVLAAYREAVERRYRFFSYGDAMLLAPRRGPSRRHGSSTPAR